MKNINSVIIYTDGACRGNPGPGGWGAVLLWKGHKRELSGGEKFTTNNRMELTAAINALSALKRSVSVDLYTDSSYLLKGMTEWMSDWKQKGWQRKSGKLENIELWQKLDSLNQKHKITWHLVRGHSGVVMNELADKLATNAIPND